jgi:hypothetical protein
MTSRKPNGGQSDLFPDSAAQSATIHRSRHERHFTKLSNEGANDRRLSLDTKGLLWWMLTKPDHWIFVWSYIAKFHNIGSAVEKRIRRELQEAGYLQQRKRVHGQTGQFGQVQYDLFEAPSEQNAGNSSATGTRTTSSKPPSGTNRHETGNSVDNDAKNPSAAGTHTTSRKPPNGTNQHDKSISGDRGEGKPLRHKDSHHKAVYHSAVNHLAVNEALVSTERVSTEREQGEGGFAPPSPAPPSPVVDCGGERRSGRRAKPTPPQKAPIPPDLVLTVSIR